MAKQKEITSRNRLVAGLCAIGALIFYVGERFLLPQANASSSAIAFIVRETTLVAVSILIAYAALRLVPLSPSRLGLRAIKLETLFWGTACAGAVFVAGMVVVAIMLIFELPVASSSLGVLNNRNPLLIVGYAGATAICEELIFRGALIALFTTLFGSRWIAAGLALVLYPLASFQGLTIAEALFMIFPGIVLTGFYLWKRDIAICIIGHAGARLVGMFLAGLLARLG